MMLVQSAAALVQIQQVPAAWEEKSQMDTYTCRQGRATSMPSNDSSGLSPCSSTSRSNTAPINPSAVLVKTSRLSDWARHPRRYSAFARKVALSLKISVYRTAARICVLAVGTHFRYDRKNLAPIHRHVEKPITKVDQLARSLHTLPAMQHHFPSELGVAVTPGHPLIGGLAFRIIHSLDAVVVSLPIACGCLSKYEPGSVFGTQHLGSREEEPSFFAKEQHVPRARM